MRIEGDGKVRREQDFAAFRLGIFHVIDRRARRAAQLVLDDHRRRIDAAHSFGEYAGR